MASPDETSLGQDATWTKNSKTVTLTTAVTANIDDGEVAWTASANVTSTADTLHKENTKSAKHVIVAGFTTGLVSYKATGALNLSGYQQVSFWLYTTGAIAASTLSLRLCSDTAGVTTVNTIAIQAVPGTSNWVALTVDTAGALGASIQSVALYADLDPGAVTVYLDNIIACKASGSADSLTLTSLIGKVWNLCWVASSTYAANTIRKPTQPNRNGFRYKVTAGGGGAAGASEPTWPVEIGTTVTDGALTWTCLDLEDTWNTLASINGTTLKVDNTSLTSSTQGRGYSGDTETLAIYKREPIKMTMIISGVSQAVAEGGTEDNQMTFSGGWNRTDMTTQTGETWISGQYTGGSADGFNPNYSYVTLTNLNAVRYATGFTMTAGPNSKLVNCHAVSCISCIQMSSACSLIGVHAANGQTTNGQISADSYSNCVFQRVSSHGNSGNNATVGIGIALGSDYTVDVLYCYNNFLRGVDAYQGRTMNHVVTRDSTNGTAPSGIYANADVLRLRNSLIQESTPYYGAIVGLDSQKFRVYSQDHNQVAGTHLITFIDDNYLSPNSMSIVGSATDQRHTASGIAWKFQVKSPTGSGSGNPLFLSVAKVAVNASALVTLSIWTRRDSTNIKGRLVVPGGQIAGVPIDVVVACEPSINTWTQYSLTFTPTQAGVVEILFKAWDGVDTTNNLWIDDFSAAQ